MQVSDMATKHFQVRRIDLKKTLNKQAQNDQYELQIKKITDSHVESNSHSELEKDGNTQYMHSKAGGTGSLFTAQQEQQKYLVSLMNHCEPRDQKILIPFFSRMEGWSLRDHQEQLEEWLGSMQFSVTSAAFQHLLKKNLTYEEVKIFCSENLLLNILTFLKSLQSRQDYIETVREINEIMNKNLVFLMKKYPLTKDGQPNKKLREAAGSTNHLENDEIDMISKSQVDFKLKESADYKPEIMGFFNYLVGITSAKCQYSGKQTNYFRAFSEIMEKIFQWVEFPEDVITEDNIYDILTQNKGTSDLPSDASESEPSMSDEPSDSQSIDSQQLKPAIASKQTTKQSPKKTPAKKNPAKLSEPHLKAKKQTFTDKINTTLNDKELAEYKEKVRRYTSYRIGQKINPNTELYSEEEINNSIFSVKSTALLRVLTKWIEHLESKILEAKTLLLRRPYRFKGQSKAAAVGEKGQEDNLVYIKLDSNQKNKLYQTSQKYVGAIEKYERHMYEECMNVEATLVKIISAEATSHIPRQEQLIGAFCTKLESAACIYLINYLNNLIDVLLQIPQQANADDNAQEMKENGNKSKCKDINLITFKVSDLMRCKCHSHESEILRILSIIKRMSDQVPELLRIIRIKDRLDQGTRDILINVNFMNKIICEIQLAITDTVQEKQKVYDKFTHYLYELWRSKLGPVMQCSCIWAHLDQRSRNFRTPKSRKAVCDNRISMSRSHLCDKPQMIPYEYSFACSLCGVFYSSLPGLLPNEKCLSCHSYYQCRKCYENKLSEDELKGVLGLLRDHLIHFKDMYQRFYYYEGATLPNYGLLVPKKSRDVQYYFFQKVSFNETNYLVKVEPSHNERNKQVLGVNILYSTKNEGDEIEELNENYFVFEWNQKKSINSTLKSEATLQRLKEEKEIKQKSQMESIKKNLQRKKEINERKERERMLFKVEHSEDSEGEDSEGEDSSHDSERPESRQKRSRKGAREDKKNSKEEEKKNKKKARKTEKKVKEDKASLKQHSPNSTVIIEDIAKRSNFFDSRVCMLNVNGSSYYLLLGFYMDEGSIKNRIKLLENSRNIIELLENRNQVLALEGEDISNELNLGQTHIERYKKNLGNITQLYLDENKIFDFEFIENFRKLRILNASNNSIMEIEELDKLKEVVEINLAYNQIDQIAGLDNKRKLRKVNLSGNHIQQLEGLRNLKQLTQLLLSSNLIDSIKGLETCPNLEELSLSCNEIEKIEGLGGLNKLKLLDLADNCLKNIDNLDHNLNLETLNLSMNEIATIRNLSHLKKLKKLYLGRNRIEKTENLEGLLELQVLSLYSNKIKRFNCQTELHKLQSLDLTKNRVSKLEMDSFDKLPQLRELFLDFNYISSFNYQIFRILPSLHQLSLYGNPFRKTDPNNSKFFNKLQKHHKQCGIKWETADSMIASDSHIK